MLVLHYVLLSFPIYSFVLCDADKQSNTPLSHSLVPRVRIDAFRILSCSREERLTIMEILREAANWVRLVLDTTEDRQTERPDNAQYQAWRRARQELFYDYFEADSRQPWAEREEIGVIYESLRWELNRSPGGTRQNQDRGGNVVRLV